MVNIISLIILYNSFFIGLVELECQFYLADATHEWGNHILYHYSSWENFKKKAFSSIQHQFLKKCTKPLKSAQVMKQVLPKQNKTSLLKPKVDGMEERKLWTFDIRQFLSKTVA